MVETLQAKLSIWNRCHVRTLQEFLRLCRVSVLSLCCVHARGTHTGKEAPEEHAGTRNRDERVGKDGAASKMEKDLALEGAKFVCWSEGLSLGCVNGRFASTSGSCLRRVVEPGGWLCDRSALSRARRALSLPLYLSLTFSLLISLLLGELLSISATAKGNCQPEL